MHQISRTGSVDQETENMKLFLFRKMKTKYLTYFSLSNLSRRSEVENEVYYEEIERRKFKKELKPLN